VHPDPLVAAKRRQVPPPGLVSRRADTLTSTMGCLPSLGTVEASSRCPGWAGRSGGRSDRMTVHCGVPWSGGQCEPRPRPPAAGVMRTTVKAGGRVDRDRPAVSLWGQA
jgi:hypothetical protein